MRPVVLVAPSGPEERGATTAPALQLLGGSRLVDRLLGTLAEVCPPPAVVVAPSAIAVRLEGTLPHGAVLVPRDGSRRDQILAALEACDERALLLHDAERALTPASAHREVMAALVDGVDAVVPTVAMTDSVKEAGSAGLRNIDRSTLAVLQSPRLLRREALRAATARMAGAVGTGADAPEDEILAVLAGGGDVRTVHGSHDGFAVVDRLTLWQAQISLGLARDTTSRQGLARRT